MLLRLSKFIKSSTLWIGVASLFAIFFFIWGTAWFVRQTVSIENGHEGRLSRTQATWVRYVTGFPGLTRDAILELLSRVREDPIPLLVNKVPTEQAHWIRHFPEQTDSGYLLFSGVDPIAKKSIVKLIRISDGTVIATWNPDWKYIFEQIEPKRFSPTSDYTTARAVHPLLLDNGDIIFNTLVSLVRMSICSPKPVWLLDEWADHSVEADLDGSIWAQSQASDGFSENPWLQEHLRDDGLLHLSTDGRILENISFSRILRENGFQSLLLGTSDFSQRSDPAHLNEIQVARQKSRYWDLGDLLISARNLSTIFLYRPSSRKIIWHRTGPWMNQHSVDFVDDHRISVFDNNIIFGPPGKYAFMTPSDINRVLVFDFESGQTSQPYAELLAATRPITHSQGRARILPDGGLFLEETDYGRHIRFTKEKLLWSRVNDYDDKRTGNLAWSRYFTAEEVSTPLSALTSRRCGS